MLMTYLIPLGLSLNQCYEYYFGSYFGLSSRTKYLSTNLFQYTVLGCFGFPIYIYIYIKFHILFFLYIKKRFHPHPNLSATFIILTYVRSFYHSQQILLEKTLWYFKGELSITKPIQSTVLSAKKCL